MQPNSVGDELRHEAVLDVARHLDGDVLHGALDGDGQLGVSSLRDSDGELCRLPHGHETEVLQLHGDLGEAAAAAAAETEIVAVLDAAEEGGAGHLVVVEGDLDLVGDGLLGSEGDQALPSPEDLDSVGNISVIDGDL